MSGALIPGESITITVPPFPAVNPFSPGVPPVSTPAIDAVATPIAVTKDGITPALFIDPVPWGYYLGGVPLLPNASVVAFEFRRDEVVSTAPQEQGAFMDYNKVSNPFTAKVRYAVKGEIADRAVQLNIILAAEESLDLYDLVMPEGAFENANITRHDFQRTSRNGVTLIMIDVYCEEIRQVGAAGFTTGTTATPGGADAGNGGPVQPATPTGAEGATVPANPPPVADGAVGTGAGAGAVAPATSAVTGAGVPDTTIIQTTPTGNAAGGAVVGEVPTTAVGDFAAII